MYEIKFYINKNGESEIYNYLERLRNNRNSKDSKIKLNKITAYIDILSKYGLSIGMPYIKHIEDDIWELRPLKDRIFFAYYDKDKFILLNYFVKKTQKTPRAEISKAKLLFMDYLGRMKNNE